MPSIVSPEQPFRDGVLLTRMTLPKRNRKNIALFAFFSIRQHKRSSALLYFVRRLKEEILHSNKDDVTLQTERSGKGGGDGPVFKIYFPKVF